MGLGPDPVDMNGLKPVNKTLALKGTIHVLKAVYSHKRLQDQGLSM